MTGLTFLFIDSIASRQYKSSLTATKWAESEIRTWLRGDAWNGLPASLKANGVIKPVKKVSYIGDLYSSPSTAESNNQHTEESLFLLSFCETQNRYSSDAVSTAGLGVGPTKGDRYLHFSSRGLHGNQVIPDSWLRDVFTNLVMAYTANHNSPSWAYIIQNHACNPAFCL